MIVSAANDPCDKLGVTGTGLSTAKINIHYTYIEELSKVNSQVSLFHQHQPITMLTERTEKKNKQRWYGVQHSSFLVSNCPLTLMVTTSPKIRRHICLVIMSH